MTRQELAHHSFSVMIVVSALAMAIATNIPDDLAQAFVEPEDFEPPALYDPKSGRPLSYQPKLFVWSVPAAFISSSNFTVFANVQDEFGDIQEAILTYSVDHSSQDDIRMHLITGTPNNGTFAATIPSQRAESLVDIDLLFRDSLGYHASYSRESIPVEQDNEPPTLFCRVVPNDPSFWQTVIVWCQIKDSRSGVAEVKFLDPESRETNLLYPAAVVELGGVYQSKPFPAGDIGTNHTFVVIAQDYAGNIATSDAAKYSVADQKQVLVINAEITGIDMQTMTADAELSADGNIQLHSGQEPKIRIPSIVNGREEQFIFPVRVDPLSDQKSVTVPLALDGESWLYPFDSYRANAKFTIPESSIQEVESKVSYDEGVSAYWDSKLQDETKIVNFGKQGSDTIHSTEISFSRLPHVAAGIYLPLFAIFYLLGAIFAIKKHPNHLTNKLGISIGTFAFIFAFTEVIDTLKPVTGGVPTIADIMIFSAAIATIGYSIGGVFETHYKNKYIDKLVFMVVSAFIVSLFIVQNYPIIMTAIILSAVIGGLGYGLVVRQIRPSFTFKEEAEMEDGTDTIPHRSD